MTRHRRRPAAHAVLAVLGLLLLLLAACGGNAPETQDDEPTTTGASAADAFPVTLEQPRGAVTIEAPPQRVYVVDSWGLDIVTQLGVTPVGASVFFEPSPWVAEQPTLEGVDITTITELPPYETIAAARPDLIVDASGYWADDDDVMSKLEALAPVVTAPGDYLTVGWRERIRQVGAALGLADEADAAVAGAEATFAEIAEDNPALDGAAVTFGRFDAPSTFALIVDDTDFTRAFLDAELGFVTPEAQATAYTDGTFEPLGGMIEGVPLERLDLVDADADAALIWFPGGEKELDTLEKQPLWRELPVVAEDRLVVLDNDDAIALRTPTPASIAWAADNLFPAVADAVGRA